MAEFKIGEVSGETKDEMVTTYAALILHDAEKEVNPDNINKLVAASGNTVEPYWPTLYSKMLSGKVYYCDLLVFVISLRDFLLNIVWI